MVLVADTAAAAVVVATKSLKRCVAGESATVGCRGIILQQMFILHVKHLF